MKRATIVDVAKLANVSTATVSRVLHTDYPVKDQTRERVLEAVRKLDYEVDLTARSLKMDSTHLIGLIVPDISNAYFMNIASALERVLRKNKYVMLCLNSDESYRREQTLLHSLRQYKVDGLVVVSCCTRTGFSAQGIEAQIPCVLIDSECADGDVAVVGTDERASMVALTEYLIRQGHRKIAILHGNLQQHTGYERRQGFLKAMEKHGLEVLPEFELVANFSREKAEAQVRKLLAGKKHLPDALICSSNLMAQGALSELRRQGVGIPEEISLVSYDPLCAPGLMEREITHMSDISEKIGRKAGELLLNRIVKKTRSSHGNGDVYTFKKELIEGQSVRVLVRDS